MTRPPITGSGVKPPPAKEDGVRAKDDCIVLSVRLLSGRFESSVQVPLFASDEEKEAFVDAWLKLMEAGLRCGMSRRENKDAEG